MTWIWSHSHNLDIRIRKILLPTNFILMKHYSYFHSTKEMISFNIYWNCSDTQISLWVPPPPRSSIVNAADVTHSFVTNFSNKSLLFVCIRVKVNQWRRRATNWFFLRTLVMFVSLFLEIFAWKLWRLET